ncbi:MAG TPA: hypothetical protein VK994_00305 [Bacteroidales bacterium]|nr:hypothetical protein [Bacteroidales bacterium]
MKISRSIFLIFLSFIMFVPSGCYMSKYRNGGTIDISGPGYQELRPFAPGFAKALYHAELSVNGHEFSGLLMIKSFAGNSHKVAFFSELGLNFFDFELRPMGAKNKLNLYINNIYSPLDRNILLNSLEKYFSMLLGPGLDEGQCKTYLKKDGSMVLVKTDSYSGKDAYLSRNFIEPYTEIVNLSKLCDNDRITIALSSGKHNSSPDSIHIKQPGLRLEMKMELVK